MAIPEVEICGSWLVHTKFLMYGIRQMASTYMVQEVGNLKVKVGVGG